MQDKDVDRLVAQLGCFDAGMRREGLEKLAAAAGRRPPGDWKPEVNLHCHTFFSYNALDFSPSRFAWEARCYGLSVAGIVDFDVVDGVVEFLEAGRLLGLKTTAGFETRVFVREYAGKVINSPHEPGVMYLVGTGFVEPPRPGTPAAATLALMADCARRRNLTMLGRINAHLDPVVVDYQKDVLSLTPAGNATERHMLAAHEARAREVFPERAALCAFWSDRMGLPADKVESMVDDPVTLKDTIRARLMKHGGVGYAAPEQGSFPSLEEVVQMTLSCGAVPSGCWLDGTSPGEADPEEHFAFLRSKGVPTLTVIPDRNWNIADPADREVKVRNFHAALEAAERLEMPVFVGTEMNKAGAKFVDTFSAPEMEPHRRSFLAAAHLGWAHTLLRMTMGSGYTGPWAGARFGDDVSARQAFFQRIGELPCPGEAAFGRLAALSGQEAPDDVLRALCE